MKMNDLDIKKIRNNLGITQKKLAEMVGVSVNTILNWESGGNIPKSKHPILQSLTASPHIVYGGQHVQDGDAINGDKLIDNSYIKDLRQKLGVTQGELAKRIGVDIKTIQNWESGRTIPSSKIGILQSLMPTSHVV